MALGPLAHELGLLGKIGMLIPGTELLNLCPM